MSTAHSLEENLAAERCLEDLVRIRIELGDPNLALAIYVLKPVCEYCRYEDDNLDLLGAGPHVKEKHVLFPRSVPGVIRRYYRTDHRLCLHVVPGLAAPTYEIPCSECGIPINPLESPQGVSVQEELYFYPNKAKKNLSKKEREKLGLLYGGQCLSCKRALSKKSLTVDHVIPKVDDKRPSEESVCALDPSFDAGVFDWANLQPLCDQCNGAKGDTNPKIVRVILDRLIRPPSEDDGYGIV